MKLLSFLAAAAGFGSNQMPHGPFNIFNAVRNNFRGATPSRHVRTHSHKIIDGCRQSNKDDTLPRGYPGAKLARKAAMNFAGVKHMRGLRVNGIAGG